MGWVVMFDEVCCLRFAVCDLRFLYFWLAMYIYAYVG